MGLLGDVAMGISFPPSQAGARRHPGNSVRRAKRSRAESQRRKSLTPGFCARRHLDRRQDGQLEQL